MAWLEGRRKSKLAYLITRIHNLVEFKLVQVCLRISADSIQYCVS